MRYFRRIFGAAALSILTAAVVGAVFFVPLPLERIRERIASPALYDSEGRLFHLRLSAEAEWSMPVPLAGMGKWLPRIAVGIEDQRFYSHPGLDVFAVARALWQNVTSRRVISGASTITSQVIRLSISEREMRDGVRAPGRRNLATKAREFVQALKLERVMGKDEILEIYLNRAPFGGNIRGVQAAALIYFGKPASSLSPGEASLLVGMLKGPSLYRPDRRPEAAKRRRDMVIRLLEKRGVLRPGEARLALTEALPSHWIQPPRRAFHFAEMLLKDRALSGRIDTTLDLEAQTKLEAIMTRTVAALPESVTAAAGVVDNKTGNLTAWVGNARFGKGGRNAWVDCGQALRSPGSALKPFAYMAAFDQGLLSPSSLLADSPLAFSGRAPRNFDLTYRGAVSARVALADSLNAPAVRVLRMAGPENVLGLMRRFGFGDLRGNASFYGDSLILGGCEVSVLQMLEAYTAIASGGLHRPLTLLKRDGGEGKPAAARLGSAAAAWMVSDILDNTGRVSTLAREGLQSEWHAAFKTGTSYGLRDAWTAAWTPDFTVVVWVGNPSGAPWGGLVGLHAAAPAALSVLRAVSPIARWYSLPPGLVLREVCALSGHPPTAACLSVRSDWSIRGVTRTLPCNIHVIRNGKSALMWPSELASQETAQTEIRKDPVVSIASPLAEAVYYLAPLAKEQKIPLRAEGARGRVWWYLNGRYIGTSPPSETFFHSFPDGRHLVSASDAEGRTAATRFTVLSPGKSRRRNEEDVILN
ncbi:MAG: penicillin-binding protein 1C [Synergistaceae bacterium]|jgi:penicillin-binding protein 1C|nr:penicillin-binding protein 1C [Synergistaceae bacterium]